MQLIRGHPEFADFLLQPLLNSVELSMNVCNPSSRWRWPWSAKAKAEAVLLSVILISRLNRLRLLVDLMGQIIHDISPTSPESNA
jgi:hypothetical protein